MIGVSVFLIIGGVWLLVLTVLVIGQFVFLGKLSRVTGTTDFKKLLEKILGKQADNCGDITEINKAIAKINHQDLRHVQRVGLVRFNPFNEIGGDHSFSLSLLDGENNGIIITGLHSRDRSRIYVKPITDGKSQLDLSDEEKKALLKAQKV